MDDNTALSLLEAIGSHILDGTWLPSDQVLNRSCSIFELIRTFDEVQKAFHTGQNTLSKQSKDRRKETKARTAFLKALYFDFPAEIVQEIERLDPRSISFLAECIQPSKLSEDETYRKIVLQTCEPFIEKRPMILDLLREVAVTSKTIIALRKVNEMLREYLQRYDQSSGSLRCSIRKPLNNRFYDLCASIVEQQEKRQNTEVADVSYVSRAWEDLKAQASKCFPPNKAILFRHIRVAPRDLDVVFQASDFYRICPITWDG